jgi:hypothetical protein
MKKGFAILITAALLLSLSSTALASKLQQVTYSSGFQVANLSSTSAAAITITYYPQTGTPVDVNDTIPAGGSVTYATIHSAAGDPFNGSVVIASDQQIAAIVNTLGDFPDYAAATGGFSEGAISFSLPLVMCNNSGFDTWFNIQNTGSSDANVTVNYVPGLAGTASSDTATIGAGRAATFDQKAGSSGSTKKCGSGLGTTFVGGATITSSQPVVATVMQINESGFNVLMGYNGFTGGADDIRAPLIMQANSGFYTGIQVQNAGSSSTNVTIHYSADTSGHGTVMPDDTFTLAAGASQTIIHSGSSTYVGAATVTSTGGVPLVAIVNQVLAGAVSYGTAYESFSAADATANVNVPLVMSENSGYYTGIQVQNVSTVNNCAVTIDYGAPSVGTYNPPDESCTLDAGESCTNIQNSGSWTGHQYVGSATVTASTPGCAIVAIVNEFAPAAGDQFYTYNAFNY